MVTSLGERLGDASPCRLGCRRRGAAEHAGRSIAQRRTWPTPQRVRRTGVAKLKIQEMGSGICHLSLGCSPGKIGLLQLWNFPCYIHRCVLVAPREPFATPYCAARQEVRRKIYRSSYRTQCGRDRLKPRNVGFRRHRNARRMILRFPRENRLLLHQLEVRWSFSLPVAHGVKVVRRKSERRC